MHYYRSTDASIPVMLSWMQHDTNDQRRLGRLRFLAEAAIAALNNETAKTEEARDVIPGDASEEMMRVVIKNAVPLLRATRHQQLADQIESFLAEPHGDARPSPVMRSDILLFALGIAAFTAVAAFFVPVAELVDAGKVLLGINQATRTS